MNLTTAPFTAHSHALYFAHSAGKESIATQLLRCVCFGKRGSLHGHGSALFDVIFGDKRVKNGTPCVNILGNSLLKITWVLVGCHGGGLGVDGYHARHRIQKNSAILDIT